MFHEYIGMSIYDMYVYITNICLYISQSTLAALSTNISLFPPYSDPSWYTLSIIMFIILEIVNPTDRFPLYFIC